MLKMIYDVMKSEIPGVVMLYPDVFRDERGSITKTFHKESFDELGLDCEWGESLITENNDMGILRGFHFQRPPFAQAKTICCVSGSIKNWVLDIRKGSPTYGHIVEFELNADKRNILYVPVGVANCYYIQEGKTVISYNLTSKYSPKDAYGINWRSFEEVSKMQNVVCSEKDNELPSFDNFETPFIYGVNC